VHTLVEKKIKKTIRMSAVELIEVDMLSYSIVGRSDSKSVDSGHVDPSFRDVDPPAEQAIRVRAV